MHFNYFLENCDSNLAELNFKFIKFHDFVVQVNKINEYLRDVFKFWDFMKIGKLFLEHFSHFCFSGVFFVWKCHLMVCTLSSNLFTWKPPTGNFKRKRKGLKEKCCVPNFNFRQLAVVTEFIMSANFLSSFCPTKTFWSSKIRSKLSVYYPQIRLRK